MYTCTIASNMRCSRGVSMASMRASCLPRTECKPPRYHLISGTVYCNIDCPGLQSRLASETWRKACLAAKLQLDINGGCVESQSTGVEAGRSVTPGLIHRRLGAEISRKKAGPMLACCQSFNYIV